MAKRKSRSPSGERGLKSLKLCVDFSHVAGRSPSGERGLKSVVSGLRGRLVRSLPIRGAWIEINISAYKEQLWNGRSPSGERGLKLDAPETAERSHMVAPHPGSVD